MHYFTQVKFWCIMIQYLFLKAKVEKKKHADLPHKSHFLFEL